MAPRNIQVTPIAGAEVAGVQQDRNGDGVRHIASNDDQGRYRRMRRVTVAGDWRD